MPAALHGVDLAALLARGRPMAEACRRPAPQNPGLRLGAAIGEAALAGRDKLTILTSPRLASLGDWIEQLVAESTGKAGRGIVPIVGEPIGEAEATARTAASWWSRWTRPATTDLAELSELAELASTLEGLGHPVQSHRAVGSCIELGAEFVRWEVATAAAGIVLGIDPFDQPNVQEAKDATRELLDAFRAQGACRRRRRSWPRPGSSAFADTAVLGDDPVTVDGALRALIEHASVLATISRCWPTCRGSRAVAALDRVRALVRDGLGDATTAGFGPRFLHSTGQLHKGGPANRRLPAAHRRAAAGPADPRLAGELRDADRGPGAGRPAALQARGRRVLRLHGDDRQRCCSAWRR